MASTQIPQHWRDRLTNVEAQRRTVGVEVARAQQQLRDLARGNPVLAARLDRTPPPIAPKAGYGVMPQILANAAVLVGQRPREMSYSLTELGTWVEREQTKVVAVATRAKAQPTDVAELVTDYQQIVENLDRIDQHIAYHRFWQQVGYDGRVARRLDTLDLYRNARVTDTQATAISVTEARQQLRDEMAAFRPSRHLHIERTSAACVLKLVLVTDIDDDLFLDGFRAAVDETWNRSEAMLEAGLQVQLDLVRIPIRELYPEGAPVVGEPIDLTAHRRRFDAPFVLTTGATTTHVDHNAILLGPTDLSGRTLAHELGHLLGFGDGYARIYRGGANESGFEILEVTPFPDTLMSSPGNGIVTSEMVDRLVRAYGE